jgi:hypothetical protein
MVYLDEAGISNPAHEPHVVVAGVIIHGDLQWKAVERHLNGMADRYVLGDQRAGFVFHAKDLFHGSKAFSRDQWPREKRWEILDELIAIPERLDLAIVYGSVERSALAEKHPDMNAANQMVNAHLIAFSICSYAIELYMRHVAPDEVACIIMENNDQVRHPIKHMQQFNRDPTNSELLTSLNFGELVLSHVVDTVHFAEKTESSPLQVADSCAFAIKRHLMKTPESDRFYKPLVRKMVIGPKEESQFSGKWQS